MHRILASAAAMAVMGSFSAPALADALPWVPPPGFEQVSPCVPKMDQHWVDKKTAPLGPFYNVHDGKLIGIEYAVSAEDLVAGKSWLNLGLTYNGKPLTLDHVDIGWQPKGHPGFEVPHYDIHLYLIPDAEVLAITCK